MSLFCTKRERLIAFQSYLHGTHSSHVLDDDDARIISNKENCAKGDDEGDLIFQRFSVNSSSSIVED